MREIIIVSLVPLITSSIATAEEIKIASPTKKETITYKCSNSFCSAWVEDGNSKLFFFKEVKTATITAKWASPDLAHVSFSCGSPCSVSFFYKKTKGISKEIHDILAINTSKDCVLTPTEDGIATFPIFATSQINPFWYIKYNDKKINFYTKSAVIFSTIHAKFNKDDSLEFKYTKNNGSEGKYKVEDPCKK